jgi:hypothetical protein
MGNCRPLLINLGTQAKTDTMSLKFTKAEVQANFQDGCRRHVGNSSEWYEMGYYHPILMKIGTQTKKNMPS